MCQDAHSTAPRQVGIRASKGRERLCLPKVCSYSYHTPELLEFFFMHPRSVEVRLLVIYLLAGSSLVFFGLANHVSGQGQQQVNQQRPRVVGTQTPNTQPQSTNSQQQTSSTGEEVAEGDVIRVETQLVSVPTVVTDRTGHPITGLDARNFAVFEDGKPQNLTNFATTGAPFEIALLLDTSGSTRDELGLIRNAANSFIGALRPGDRVALVAFNNVQRNGSTVAVIENLSPLTDDRAALRKAIARIGTSNGTPFYDALGKIGSQIFRDPPREDVRGRRAVVALTDGVDSTSDTGYEDARAALARAGVASYFIQVSTEDYVEDRLLKDCQDDGRLSLSAKQLERFRTIFVPRAQKEDYQDFCRMGPFERMDISRQLYNLARREMDQMAKDSGGKNFAAVNLQEARAAFAEVANEIGTQYSLGYYPSNKTRDGRFRQIKVELRGVKDANVRAREGYYAPKESKQ
jgi:VWFA-related protein